MGPGRISHPFHVLSLQHAFKFVCDVIFQTIFFSKGVVLPSLDALPLLQPRRGSLPGQQMAQLAQRFYVWWQFLFGVFVCLFFVFCILFMCAIRIWPGGWRSSANGCFEAGEECRSTQRKTMLPRMNVRSTDE